MNSRDVVARFGLGRAVRLSEAPVARGKEGHVWRLDTTDGSYAVKVPLDPPREDEVERTARFQEAAYEAGVPTPRVVRTPDGNVFAAAGGTVVRVHEWVDLLAADTMLDPQAVGEVVAAVHQVRLGGQGAVDTWYCEPVGAERWDRLVELLRREGAPFAGQLAGLRDELVALESWVEPPQSVRFCHRDLWADNLLPTAGGGVCVIDWDNSGPADPSQELGCVLFEFSRGDAVRARALVRAYRAAGGPGRVSRRGHFSMLIAQLGHILEAGARDWLEPNPRSPDRAAATAWVHESLDEPLTRAGLDFLLAAVVSAEMGQPPVV